MVIREGDRLVTHLPSDAVKYVSLEFRNVEADKQHAYAWIGSERFYALCDPGVSWTVLEIRHAHDRSWYRLICPSDILVWTQGANPRFVNSTNSNYSRFVEGWLEGKDLHFSVLRSERI